MNYNSQNVSKNIKVHKKYRIRYLILDKKINKDYQQMNIKAKTKY